MGGTVLAIYKYGMLELSFGGNQSTVKVPMRRSTARIVKEESAADNSGGGQ